MNIIRKLVCGLALGLILQVPLLAAEAEFPQYGFRIDTLDRTLDAESVQVVVMCLPASDGFMPNVTVQIQPFSGSLADYIAKSKKQFAAVKMQIVSEQQKGDAEWIVEYSGTVRDTDLHWYARAVLDKQKVYLISATAKNSQWPQVADQLKKNVDSFKLMP